MNTVNTVNTDLSRTRWAGTACALTLAAAGRFGYVPVVVGAAVLLVVAAAVAARLFVDPTRTPVPVAIGPVGRKETPCTGA